MATAAAQHQESCPWCQQPISRAKFLQIETRIRDEQKRQLEQAEAEMRAKLAAEREVLETKSKAERTTLELQLQSLRETVEKAKEKEEQFERQLKEAKASAVAAERKKLEAELALKYQADLERDRALLKTELVKKDAEHQKGMKTLLKQNADLQKKLAEAANEKPEVVDINVVDALKAEFKTDRVLPLPKAAKSDGGGDVLFEVKYKNNVFCGKILIDSRVRGNWRPLYAAKLHTDATEQGADHAILCTVHFPDGASEVYRHDDVLLVHPARVVEIVAILRDALLRMHKSKLTNEQRAEKTAQLYSRITSDGFRRKLKEVETVIKEVQQIDADEQEAHRKVQEKRGRAMLKLEKLHKQVVGDIDDIVDGIEDDDGRGN
jgi:hypothetical protein